MSHKEQLEILMQLKSGIEFLEKLPSTVEKLYLDKSHVTAAENITVRLLHDLFMYYIKDYKERVK